MPDPPLEAADLARRLARMKQLIEELERVCRESGLQSEMLAALRREMEAARQALELIP